MTETREYMIPVQIDKTCECTKGKMRPTGVAQLTLPARYDHACNSCGKEAHYYKTYPYIMYEPMSSSVIAIYSQED